MLVLVDSMLVLCRHGRSLPRSRTPAAAHMLNLPIVVDLHGAMASIAQDQLTLFNVSGYSPTE